MAVGDTWNLRINRGVPILIWANGRTHADEHHRDEPDPDGPAAHRRGERREGALEGCQLVGDPSRPAG